jgi:hypothetical protein
MRTVSHPSVESSRRRRPACRPAVLIGALVAAGCSGGAGDTAPSAGGFALELVPVEEAGEWQGFVADYPDGQLGDVGLVTEPRTIAVAGLGEASGVYHFVNNISDDLFSALWRRVDGLEDRPYTFDVEVELATPYGAECQLGAAGNVFLKPGLSTAPPDVFIDEGGWVRATVDHGQQSVEGPTFPILGDLTNDLPGCDPAGSWGPIVGRTAEPIVITPVNGAIYVFLSTESAWEGPHELLWLSARLTERE